VQIQTSGFNLFFWSRFRKLAMKYHPDQNKSVGSEKKFQELAESYDILSDRKSNLRVFTNCKGTSRSFIFF